LATRLEAGGLRVPESWELVLVGPPGLLLLDPFAEFEQRIAGFGCHQ